MRQNDKKKIRDRFWVWAHIEGAYNGEWGLGSTTSRITPYEGAAYMGVGNLIFIRYSDKPEPPFNQYATPLGLLDRLEWSITGAGGATSEHERESVYDLAAAMPNISGFMMDDFFTEVGAAKPAALTVDDLVRVRERIQDINGRQLSLSVVLYDYNITDRVVPYLELCDSVSFYTWKAENLKNLESNMDSLERLVPGHKIRLGCYMWDFGGTMGPMPVSGMKHQCELGRAWLDEGRITDMIFLGTNICDLGLETVEWTRNWIAEVGDDAL